MNKTREELDEMIQNMPLTELKAYFEEARTINPPIILGDILAEEEEISVMEEPSIPYGKPSLAEKMKKTGLSRESLLQVEHNKQKATLEEITAYCKGMDIELGRFILGLSEE